MTRLALDRSTTVEATAEPILAWRTWALTGRRDGSCLLLRPVAARSRPWPPRRAAEAVCRTGWSHPAPDLACTCGLYAARLPDLLRRTRMPAVWGRVALWGRVIEHELGFRSRFGYPQRLRLVCRFCFWLRGADGPAPTRVGRFRRGDLVPMCEAHVEIAARFGMRPRTLLPVDEVERSLLATYAVDPLPG